MLKWLALSALVGAFCLPASAQVASAEIRGTILDSSGAAVASAKVVATNRETNVSRDTTSDTTGNNVLGTYDQSAANSETMPPSTIVCTRPIVVPRIPPMNAPIGIVPQTMVRMVAFIRPWTRSGVIACRRLTWLML